MPIIDSREDNLDVSKDVQRHHDKIKEIVKKKLPEIISQEDIITQDNKGKKIKVPVKSLSIPDLRHGKRSGNGGGDGEGDGEGEGKKVGMGQGPGKKGDEMGRKPGQQQGEGGESKAGNDPGEDMIESEFTVEEIVEMMFEDLGLPNLLKKDLATIEVSLGYKITGMEKVGPMVLLKKRPTAKNAMKTFWVLMGLLQEKFKDRSELDCFAALKQEGGGLYEAEQLLLDPNFKHDLKQVEPFPIIGNGDLRYFDVQDKKTSETNAVVFAILDVSGSMGDHKKYISRAILFWLVQVLRRQYTNVEIRFIVHHSSARLIEEKDFFRTMESGGTVGHTAFSLVNDLIKSKYPTDIWNVYAFYFSDGDDFEPEKTGKEMKKMLDSGINMFCFANIKESFEEKSWGYSSFTNDADLISHIKGNWPIETVYLKIENPESGRMDSMEVITGKDGFPFIAVTISNKAHVFTVLREFLKKNR
ncbi:MAG: hypothetical protein UT05_C0001G0059 [Parcubacteria group bacterium GW2011_GWF2_38_76]|nr:MAG: hypothetical protein UT05_C0001G0059 [Parcubacteria group bacterium GW2011_GWF2_38_76]HBM45964.1 hypothetical protein [Patescibacteria group bacterium]